MTINFNELECSLCSNKLPSGALFQFYSCEKCGDTVHDACLTWKAPQLIEEEDGIIIHKAFCHKCGNGTYIVLTPTLWLTPSGKIIESKYMWNGEWSNYL